MSIDRLMPDNSSNQLLGATVLVHVELPAEENQEDLEELKRLVESAGGEACETFICRREAPDPSSFIGSGKVLEVAAAVNAAEAKTVVFNSKLSPAQERNLEKAFSVRVMDRIALILLIFAQRARTYEGKLQVELAQLQYEQARLVRGWTHLERQKGGFGLRGGPGETQIELDRRALRERITIIKRDLEIVARRREQNRNLRRRNSINVVSFVGYTNAGKSTLFNRLCGSDVYAADKLFATLDPTLRTVNLKSVGKTVFADTVGFIRHLPHDLIAAFRSTLEETAQADLLLHIVDASDPRKEDNIKAVDEVLKQVGAAQVKTLIVYNKSDLVTDSKFEVVRDEKGLPTRVYVSAKTGEGLENLLDCVSEILCDNLCNFEVVIPPSEGKLRAFLYAALAVKSESYDDNGNTHLQLSMPAVECARIDKQTSGALSRTCIEKNLPWIEEEFDFDSVE